MATRVRPHRWQILVAALSIVSSACASNAPRVALVVGNAHYAHAKPLANPENDARAISQQLTALGWKVALVVDPDRSDIESAVQSLDSQLEYAEKVIFFYAGHGMQVNGRNYIVPVDFDPSHAVNLNEDMISLDSAFEWLKRPKNQLVVFLDACRDNPFEDQLARTNRKSRGLEILKNLREAKTRKFEIGRGLAEVSASAGTFVAYATQPGNVALDGDSEHSPFTNALLHFLPANNKDISWVMQRVRNEVIEQTHGSQVPWDHSSLTDRFLVNPKQLRSPPP